MCCTDTMRTYLGLCIALTYGTISTSMAFINKMVLSTYQFNYPIFLMVAQMLTSTLILEALRLTNLIQLPKFTLERGWKFFFPSLLYAIHCVMALWSLGGMSIPMYSVLKRCSPLVIMGLGYLLLKKGQPSCKVVISIFAVTSGCILAGEKQFCCNCLNPHDAPEHHLFP